MLSLPTSLFILVAVILTSFLSGILGMAGGMVLMGAMTWVLPVSQAMILHSVTQFAANGSRAFFHRKYVYKSSLGYYLLGLIGMLLALSLITYMPDKIVVFIFLGMGPFVAYMLPRNLKLNFTKPGHAVLCGAMVTVFQLTGGVSGPFLDIFFQTNGLTRHQTVATKACTQALSHTAKFIYFSFIVSSPATAWTGVPLWLYFAVVPVAIIGTNASKTVLERLTDKQFYKATQLSLFIIGGIYLCKAFSLWRG